MIEFGIAQMSKPGFELSGDGYVLEQHDKGTLVAVIDGLGHGDKAHHAAQAAVAALKHMPHDSAMSLMQRCHLALTGTRGAVISVATLVNDQLTWLGVGNVEGVLLRADGKTPRERLLLRGGVVGYRMPTLRTFNLPLQRGDTLIFATDGVRSAFADNLPLHATPQHIAQTILDTHCRHTDDALVLVVRYQP
ncbi:MAG: SpoIIE family protein phosphatase [Anaerolineae bacterium]